MDNTYLKNMKVLVAEDDESCRYLMELLLTDIGCSFEIAVNGLEAISKIKAGKFDVIFMDLRMPTMNGYDAMSAIRELDRTIPVIAMTGHAGAWEDGLCQDRGMSDYLIKPYAKEQVIEKLLKWTVNKTN